MKITIESTEMLVEMVVDGRGAHVPARVWQGFTDDGIPVHCFVTRICPTLTLPLAADVERKFLADLKECRPPTSDIVAGIPLRMIL
jgi:hypothetical protein